MSRIKKVSDILNEENAKVLGNVPLKSSDKKDYRATGEDRYQAPHTSKPYISTNDDDKLMHDLAEYGIFKRDVENLKNTLTLINDLSKEIERVGFKQDRRDEFKYHVTNLINFAEILQHNEELITKLLDIDIKNIRRK